MSTQHVASAAPARKRRPLPYHADGEIVRAAHVPRLTGLSEASIWRRRKAGDFPPAIRLGPNSIGFRRADLDAWLKAREIG